MSAHSIGVFCAIGQLTLLLAIAVQLGELFPSGTEHGDGHGQCRLVSLIAIQAVEFLRLAVINYVVAFSFLGHVVQ
jgi:hypothetical protein